MAGTQASRQRLYRELGQLLSQEAMDELMDVIPPVGWGEIARRQDITNLEHSMHAEMADLRSEVRTDIADLRSEVRTDIADLRGELRTGMADMRSEFSSALRLQLFSLLGAMFTLAGLTWAATSIT